MRILFLSCQDNLMFDETTKKCNYMNQVVCKQSTSTISFTTSTSEISKTTQNLSKNLVYQRNCNIKYEN